MEKVCYFCTNLIVGPFVRVPFCNKNSLLDKLHEVLSADQNVCCQPCAVQNGIICPIHLSVFDLIVGNKKACRRCAWEDSQHVLAQLSELVIRPLCLYLDYDEINNLFTKAGEIAPAFDSILEEIDSKERSLAYLIALATQLEGGNIQEVVQKILEHPSKVALILQCP